MLLRLGVILLVLAIPASFPGHNSETLRKQFGSPMSETFLVRPGIVVTANYGASGNTCELLIRPKGADNVTGKSSSDIDYDLLKAIENELVPVAERGEHVVDAFIDMACLWGDDCPGGTQEDWENVVIYTTSGKTGARSEAIQWNRDECGPRLGFHLKK